MLIINGKKKIYFLLYVYTCMWSFCLKQTMKLNYLLSFHVYLVESLNSGTSSNSFSMHYFIHFYLILHNLKKL